MTKSKGDKTDPCGRPSLKVRGRPALALTRACRKVQPLGILKCLVSGEKEGR